MSDDNEDEEPNSIPLSELQADLQDDEADDRHEPDQSPAGETNGDQTAPSQTGSEKDSSPRKDEPVGEEASPFDTFTATEGQRGSSDSQTEEPQAETAESTPLERLRKAITGASAARTGTTGTGGQRDAFFQENVDSVDSDEIWADLLMEDGIAEGLFDPEATEWGRDGKTQIISKRICEQCRYVTEPPELSCTHEGTTIHELVDVDHVRVSDCPMVGPDGEKKGKAPPEADEA